MSFILDTNILIELEKGNKKVVSYIENVRKSNTDEFYITFFTFCEFYKGIIKKNEKNKGKILNRLEKYRLLQTSKEAGISACHIMLETQKKGKSLSQIDVMIAGIAKANRLPLITMDKAFKDIPGLKGYFLVDPNQNT